MATSNTLPHGLINSYQVDYQSGFLYTMPDSPIDAGGRNTAAIVLAPNNLFLYTVNNFDSNVVEFAIGTDGKLYPEHTYNINGSLPTAAAIDAAGKFLYVTFTYQNSPISYTPANPGPGGITVFPINSDNSLGTPLPPVNIGRNPVGIATSKSGNYVYVIDQDSATTLNLLAFSQGTTGALTPLSTTTINPGNVPSTGTDIGPQPAGILEDSTGTHLYVTDKSLNVVATYSISNGIPTKIATTVTDSGPMGMSFDLTGKYLYIAANTANVIDGYNIGSNGVPVRSSVAGSTQAGNGPTCISVSGSPSNASPDHAVYMYVSNSLSNNLTAEQLKESDGSLYQIQGSPFVGSSLPACVVTAPAYPIRQR
jgi:6-phosphogluconolactonase (cycloisomerase 2 family)